MNPQVAFKELQTAHEAVQMLSWAQQWCAVAQGAEPHVASPVVPLGNWECTFAHVDVQGPFVDSRTFGITNTEKPLQQNLCVHDWLSDHVVIGDDMRSTVRHGAPFGHINPELDINASWDVRSKYDTSQGLLARLEEWPFNEQSEFWKKFRSGIPCGSSVIGEPSAPGVVR